MLQAFKCAEGRLTPFTSVNQAFKDGAYNIHILITGKERSTSFYFKSMEDRDKQFANFEAWLTVSTNSI